MSSANTGRWTIAEIFDSGVISRKIKFEKTQEEDEFSGDPLYNQLGLHHLNILGLHFKTVKQPVSEALP